MCSRLASHKRLLLHITLCPLIEVVHASLIAETHGGVSSLSSMKKSSYELELLTVPHALAPPTHTTRPCSPSDVPSHLH